MNSKTVKVSISLKKIIFLLFLVGLSAALFVWMKKENLQSPRLADNQKNLVLPFDFGVADSGFDGDVKNFTVLNTKAVIDTRDKINGSGSLKISFSDRPLASVKIPGYINDISRGGFYRLGFWAKTDSEMEKKLAVHISEQENIQELGSFSLDKSKGEKYFEFVFEAQGNAENLIITSNDGARCNVWVDDVTLEKIDISSLSQSGNIQATVFGDTSWTNVDQSQNKEDGDSADFLSKPNRKIGQIFEPSEDKISGVALKIRRHGNGGTGAYQVQLREFNPSLGVISEENLASTLINLEPKPEIMQAAEERETQMRNEFADKEEIIEKEKLLSEENTDSKDAYADKLAQDQSDVDEAAKRSARLEIDIQDMKESFNSFEEIEIPLVARLDKNEKYWIGIDNTSVAVDSDNYVSVVTYDGVENKEESDKKNPEENTLADSDVSQKEEKDNGESESNLGARQGFKSRSDGVWEESSALWFKTFYPVWKNSGGIRILSGATISDMGGGKFSYRYQFGPQDYSSLSGFSGRKIYDMETGRYASDMYGNYKMSGYDEYSVYRFDTIYPVEKMLIREVDFHQSLALEISEDGKNWEEIFSDNPGESNQSVGSITYVPKERTNVFYLKMKPSGDSATVFGLFLEAELKE